MIYKVNKAVDDYWYQAQILKINDETYMIVFVDSDGNEALVQSYWYEILICLNFMPKFAHFASN